MSLITVYPSRFTSRGEGEGVVIAHGDETVSALYDIYHARTAASRTWKYRRAVLETAMRLFGQFDIWLRDQRNNPKIIGSNRKFLEETVQYIHGGSRTLSVLVWKDLIDNADELGHAVSLQALGTDLKMVGNRESTVQVLQQWLSRPNGIEDLILTLHVLFGKR